MNFLDWLWLFWWKLAQIIMDAIRRNSSIYGESTVNMVGGAGNYIDIYFQSKLENIRLTKATWDWAGRNVWLDRDGNSMTVPENRGVDAYEFHFGDSDPNGTDDIQRFGFTATGFDSGDYFRFTMDLDRAVNGGTPYTEDYLGGSLVVEFSDDTVLQVTFDAPVNYPWGAKAVFLKR